MKRLTRFVSEKNLWNNMFGRELMDLSKLDNTLAQKLFGMLEGELSPENLCCAALVSDQAKVKARLLDAVKDLEELGYTQDPPNYR